MENTPNNPIERKKLFDFLKESNLTSLSEPDFDTRFSDTTKIKQLSTFLKKEGYSAIGDDEFQDKFFGDLISDKNTATPSAKKIYETDDSSMYEFPDSKSVKRKDMEVADLSNLSDLVQPKEESIGLDLSQINYGEQNQKEIDYLKANGLNKEASEIIMSAVPSIKDKPKFKEDKVDAVLATTNKISETFLKMSSRAKDKYRGDENDTSVVDSIYGNLNEYGIDSNDFEGYLKSSNDNLKELYKQGNLNTEKESNFALDTEGTINRNRVIASEQKPKYKALTAYTNDKINHLKGKLIGLKKTEGNEEDVKQVLNDLNEVKSNYSKYVENNFNQYKSIIKENKIKKFKKYQESIANKDSFNLSTLNEYADSLFSGFRNEVKNTSAFVLDAIGFDSMAEDVRLNIDMTRDIEDTSIDVGFSSGKKINYKGKDLLVSDEGEIIDIETEKNISSFTSELGYDQKEIHQLAKISKDQDNVFNLHGTTKNVANGLGSFVFQILTTKGIGGAVGKGASLASKTVGRSGQIIQSALVNSGTIYVNTFEENLKALREAGVNEEKAKSEAHNSAFQVAKTGVVMGLISPNTSALSITNNKLQKNIIKEVANGYSKGNVASFSKSLSKRISLNVFDRIKEGSGEYLEELIEGKESDLQKNIININNEKQVFDTKKTKQAIVNDFVTTFSTAFLMANGGKTNYKNKLEILNNLSSRVNETSNLINTLVSKGSISKEKGDRVIKEVKLFQKHAKKLPKTTKIHNVEKTLELIEKRNVLEEEKSEIDKAYHDDIDLEIKEINKQIKETASKDIKDNVLDELASEIDSDTVNKINQDSEGKIKANKEETDVLRKRIKDGEELNVTQEDLDSIDKNVESTVKSERLSKLDKELEVTRKLKEYNNNLSINTIAFAENMSDKVNDLSEFDNGVANVKVGESSVSLKENAKGNIEVKSLSVDPGNRGKGEAKKAMSELTKNADNTNSTLELTPVPLDDTTSKDKLIKLYEANGFELQTDGSMVRKPNKEADLTPNINPGNNVNTDVDVEVKSEEDNNNEIEDVSDNEFSLFLDGKGVTENTFNMVADKVKNSKPLTDKEKSIHEHYVKEISQRNAPEKEVVLNPNKKEAKDTLIEIIENSVDIGNDLVFKPKSKKYKLNQKGEGLLLDLGFEKQSNDTYTRSYKVKPKHTTIIYNNNNYRVYNNNNELSVEGKYDKKPTENTVKKVIAKYKKELKDSEKETENKDKPRDLRKEKIEAKKKNNKQETEEKESRLKGKSNKKSLLARFRSAEQVPQHIRSHIVNLGVNYETLSEAEAQKTAEGIIEKFGIAEAYEISKLPLLQGGVEGSIRSWIKLSAIEQANKERTQAVLDNDYETGNKYENIATSILEEIDIEARDSGRFNSILNRFYKRSNFQFKPSQAKKDWKNKYGEDMPKQLAEELDKSYKKIDELQTKYDEIIVGKGTLEQQAAFGYLVEEQKRNKQKERDSKKDRKRLDVYARMLRKNLKTKVSHSQLHSIGIVLAQVTINTGVEVVATSLELGQSLSDAIRKGVDKIKKTKEYQKLSTPNKRKALDEFNDYLDNTFSEGDELFDSIQVHRDEDGKLMDITIPRKLLYVEIENGAKDINDLSKSILDMISEDNPDIELRQVRDAITRYGNESSKTKSDLDRELSSMKTDGKQLSKLEDLRNGFMTESNKAKRKPSTEAQVKRIKEIQRLINGLKVNDESAKETEYKKALELRKLQLKSDIKRLEQAIQKNEKIARNDNKLELDNEATSLQETRDNLKEEYNNLDVVKGGAYERKVNSILSQKDKKIKELEFDIKMLEKNKQKTGKGSEKIKDKRIDDKNALIQKLKDQYLKLLEQKGIAEANRIENVKKVIKDRTEEYKRRIKERDFPVSKKRGLEISPELVEARKALDREQKIYRGELRKYEKSKRNKTETVADYIFDVINIPKGLKATFDLSAVFRQGFGLGLTNNKAWRDSFSKMHKMAASQDKYDSLTAMIKIDKDYLLSQDSGLSLTDLDGDLNTQEEQFISKYVEKIKGVGALMKGSERAYSGFLNNLRFNVFKKYAQTLRDNGFNETSDPEQFKALARVVNYSTGRGDLSLSKGWNMTLNALFFSPRMLASNFQLVHELGRKDGTSFSRKMARNQLLANFGGTIALKALVKIALGAFSGIEDEDEDNNFFNPLHTDFAKIKIGNTRYDVGGGEAILMRTLARTITGKSISSSGRIEENNNGGFGSNALKAVVDMLANKIQPGARYLWNIKSGHNPRGKSYNDTETGIGRLFYDHFVALCLPIALEQFLEGIGSIYKASDDEKVGKSIELVGNTILGMYGVSISEYGPGVDKLQFEDMVNDALTDK